MPSDVDIAWAAGLFEGEGSLYLVNHECGRKYARLSMASTDLDVLERFAAIVGAGQIRLDKRANDWQRKPLFRWACQDNQEALRIAALLEAHLGERRSARLADMRHKLNEQAPARLKKAAA